MASTNSTAHYELSQYIGTDKPTYLVDYNQDMGKIDAGIYEAKSEADTNSTSIGNLSNLTTSAKSNLVSAINEVDGDVAGIGDLSQLTTTVKTDLVSAINEVDSETSSIGALADLTTTSKSNLVSAINEVDGDVGDVSTLTTTSKTSVVSAINEVDGDIGDLSNLKTTVQSSVVGSINENYDSIDGIKGTILWSNNNPTASFTSQNITLNSADYDYFEIIFKMKTDLNREISSGKVKKGSGTVCSFAIKGNYYRLVNYTNDTTLDVSTGRSVPPASSTESTDNSWCIPIYVIGYNSDLFS